MKPGANCYRLPTEAEWEYAARGGNKSATTYWNYTYAGSNTVDDVAWYGDNSYSGADYGAHRVGTKGVNDAGLYDMSGNVAEWCWDGVSGLITESTPAAGANDFSTTRALRGGSWSSNANQCEVANRGSSYSSYRSGGFRVACK